ncbi:MAG: FadR family transcriptional regulator [Sphingomonadaceae bacterium]|nr:FadR family transcriptional regulator [Sphingomonadaceae bacterium]
MAVLARIPKDREVRIPKSAELVAAQIRKAIIRGTLKIGDTLPAEASLIAAYEVSRPTIREAVRILESEGLITISRGSRGGARINEPSSDMVARAAGIALQSHHVTIGDLYEMRTIIEPPAARLVAERDGKQAAKVLRAHLEKEFAVAGNPLASTRAIAEFHRLMIEQCGNVTLTMMAHALQGLVERHLVLSQRRELPGDAAWLERRTRYGLRSHAKLIALIEQGDGEGAERHWRDHMQAAGIHWLAEVAPMTLLELLD